MLQGIHNRDFQGTLPFPCCRFFAFDTRNVICVDADDAVLERAREEALRIHDAFNRFSPESEVSRMSAAAARCEDAEISCSPDMIAVLQVCLALHGETGGAFDPTVGMSACAKPDFGGDTVAFCRGGREQSVSTGGFSHVRISSDGLLRIPRGLGFDFGGIAKGYAAERVLAVLSQAGATRGFVNFGGTIAVLGPETPGSAWVFGLQKAGAEYGGDFCALIDAAWGAFATSAGYFRDSSSGGRVRSHIIDPRTGVSVDNGVAEVTVHCQSATLADALSTALFVMGPASGLLLAGDLGAEALFSMRDGSVKASPGFPARILGGCE